ncbi:MAG: ribosomal-processing cysteine protease Prp [Ruminococcus sp.]|nr:ribosomal-processing cysteine protease Prp [Ruminococcus sp.]
MILAQFYRAADNRLLGFGISGHADLDEYGLDIACASVSSAVMVTANTITDIFHIDAKTQELENDILLKLKDDPDGIGDKLLLGLLTHLYMIKEEFPEAINIRIIEK